MKSGIVQTKLRKSQILAFLLGGLFLWLFYDFQSLLYRNSQERAEFLMSNFPIIDTHNDFPWAIRSMRDQPINMTFIPTMDTDLIRMRKGHLAGQIWSAFIPCEENFTKKSDYVGQTLEQIDIIKRMVKDNPELVYVDRADQILPAFKQNRIPSLIGIEGGHQIDGSLGVLREYYELGVRYMTLTHTCHTEWADSCSPEPVHNGLTDFGKKIVREMNRLGMMVDISNVSHKVMKDVVQVSKAPLFASHSSAYALCPTTRNIPDEILEVMKERDGVIMINFWPALISCAQNSTIDQVIEHFKHVTKVAGVEHLGFGGDFDGISYKTTGLEDVSTYPKLILGLINAGFTDKEIIGIMGGNLIRILKKTELIAESFKSI